MHWFFKTTLSLMLAAAAICHAQTYRQVIARVPSLDPLDASSVPATRCVSLVNETLVEYDYAARPYKLVPGVAAALPEISSNGCVYTFHLATNHYFTADACFGSRRLSRRVVAGDFVFALKRLADPALASPGRWLVAGRVTEVSAPDDETLIIKLASPCPQFLWMLAMPYTAAIPKEAVDFYGKDFREHPVGSGPYKLKEWRRNYRMIFERNHDWPGWDKDSPHFETLVFPVMEDPSTQWLSFLAGELDLQGEIDNNNFDQVIVRENGFKLNPALAARGITLHSGETLEVSYIGINMENTVLGTNKWLRQALNAAFDCARWEEYYHGRASAANGAVPPTVRGARMTPLPFPRGIESAKKLLEKAGYPNGIDPATGRRLRLTLDNGRTTQDSRESSELIVAFMARIGIEIVPEYNTWPAFLRKLSEKRAQMFRIGWVGDYPDAENFLQLFYGPNVSPGPNRCNYSDPDYDALYKRALAAENDDERMKLYDEMQAKIQEDCPWIFAHFTRTLTLTSPGVKNFIPHDFPCGAEKFYKPAEE